MVKKTAATSAKKATKKAIPLTDEQQLEELLTRGIGEIIPRDVFVKKLRAGERMRMYLGVDPTGPDIHIGHAVILRKLRKLQDLGHEIILLIGDFTARIGDPTGRDSARVTMTHEAILENAKNYKKQASKILDFSSSHVSPAKIDFNARWLDKLSFQDVIALSSHFTVQQMLERAMFQKRMSEGKPVYIHEFLYPVMQGYDSVAMDVDVEVGGTDQTFNMLVGRTLQQEMNNREKVVMSFELLEGLDGRKMSKSYKNIVGVMDAPADMFGKIMSVADDLIVKYFWLCTDWTKADMNGVERALKRGDNPRDIKMCLARQIVRLYHGEKAATDAEAEFIRVFQQKAAPTEAVEYRVSKRDITLADVLVSAKMVSSKGEARRLAQQGGVRVNGEKISDVNTSAADVVGALVQVGKRKFVQVKK